MAGTTRCTVPAGYKVVKPMLSADFCQAHRRVIGLYRAYFRYIPHLLRYYDIPKNECDCKWKIREHFYKNACVTDIRVIDVLVIKGYMNLKEMSYHWQQKGQVMSNWHPTRERKRCDFVGKFLNGDD